ncbi:DUF6705 family protein [Chryseobacterium indoltheticum]|uniref:DUF6705 family protein n=1 Tax=Chryseobacterium indoltheticum TaxID=254 RepID=UPI0019124DD8|nr:DUF6705 family protein [Chryseobacterium indoltheticum]QQQ30012.1 hypothetical protein JJL46_08415 [Chryseobacterium indoltheticum]
MKNILTILIIFAFTYNSSQAGCSPQNIIPLRTYTEIPQDQCYYMKDTNNELQDYTGTWMGTWNNKTFYVTFKKLTNKYDDHFKYNKDLLIGKFKTLSSNGNILFDNTAIMDNDAKITGGKFIKDENNYSLGYFDKDLCNNRGFITIAFTNSTKTQLAWRYMPKRTVIYPDCYFYNYSASQYPDPLPKNIILTKQ